MIEILLQTDDIKACLPYMTEEEQAGLRHEAALNVASLVKHNFKLMQSKSGSRHFWHDAAASTGIATALDRKTEIVAVNHKGVRLQLLGGVVRPTGKPSEVTGKPTKSLLIPFEDSPMAKRRVTLSELHYPAENIHVLKSKNGCPILVAADPKKRKTNIIWLGKLIKQTTHKPHLEVMPTGAEIDAAAKYGAAKYLKKFMAEKRK